MPARHGLISSSVNMPYFTGGTISTSGGYRYHTFTTTGSSTLTLVHPGTIEYLIVGGGGGGGGTEEGTGGGGGGGVLTGSIWVSSDSNVIVGAGGQGDSIASNYAENGQNSTAFGFIAYGGGAGGRWSYDNDSPYNGAVGGSGGGGGTNYRSSTNDYIGGSGGLNTAGQGYVGGSGAGSYDRAAGGGGGGAGGAGSNGTVGNIGNTQTEYGYRFPGSGGAGLAVWGTTYAAGGSGGARNSSPSNGASGAANTGNGGGGANSTYLGFQTGGSGGSGIVIVRYKL